MGALFLCMESAIIYSMTEGKPTEADGKGQDSLPVESLKDTPTKKGGARPGAGMPKGTITKRVADRMIVKKAFLDRVAKNADKLFNAQMTIAQGVTMLFRIETDEEGHKKKPELVTDQHEIERFLEECGAYDGVMDGNDYYFLTTKAPDNRAIDSMLDRAFGKADANLDITSKGETIAPRVVSEIIPRDVISETEATASN